MPRILLALGLAFLAACSQAGAPALTEQQSKAFALAEQLEQRRDPGAAANIYRALLKQPDAPIEAYVRLASLYRKSGRALDAVIIMREAEKRAPDNPRALSQLGYALIDAKQHKDAVGVFDKLIAMEPDNAMAYNGKAVAFDQAGNHVAAQEIYQEALALAPDSLSVKNNLALSMILNGQIDAAIDLLAPLAEDESAPPIVHKNLQLARKKKQQR